MCVSIQEPTERPAVERVDVNLLGGSTHLEDVDHNIDGRVAEKSPKYSVLTQENSGGGVSQRLLYRKYRDAG